MLEKLVADRLPRNCELPIPLKVHGALPPWLVGSLFISVPGTLQIGRGESRRGSLREMEEASGETPAVQLRHMLDAFSAVLQLEFLPGGLNVLFSECGLAKELEASISRNGAAAAADDSGHLWQHAISFARVGGSEVADGALGAAAEQTSRLVTGAWGYVSSWLGGGGAERPWPSPSGVFPWLLPFSGRSGPLVIGVSPSLHVVSIDPATMDVRTSPMQLLATDGGSGPPPVATSQAYAGVRPALDPTTLVLFVPIISLSASGNATCTIARTTPELFPRFVPMVRLPRMRASVYPEIALTARFLVLVLPNYYVPAVSGAMRLSLGGSALGDVAVHRADEPLQFVVISRAESRVVGTFAGEGAIVPPGGLVGASELGDGSIAVDVCALQDASWFEATSADVLQGLQPKGPTVGQAQGSIRRYVLPGVGLPPPPLRQIVINGDGDEVRLDATGPRAPLPILSRLADYSGTELFDFKASAHYTHLSTHAMAGAVSLFDAATHVFPPSLALPQRAAASAFADSRYLFALAAADATSRWYTRVEQVSVATLETRVWESPGCLVGPLFVLPRPQPGGDGGHARAASKTAMSESVLLVGVRGRRRGLVVLSAGDLSELASVDIPADRPFPVGPCGAGGVGGCFAWGDVPAAALSRAASSLPASLLESASGSDSDGNGEFGGVSGGFAAIGEVAEDEADDAEGPIAPESFEEAVPNGTNGSPVVPEAVQPVPARETEEEVRPGATVAVTDASPELVAALVDEVSLSDHPGEAIHQLAESEHLEQDVLVASDALVDDAAKSVTLETPPLTSPDAVGSPVVPLPVSLEVLEVVEVPEAVETAKEPETEQSDAHADDEPAVEAPQQHKRPEPRKKNAGRQRGNRRRG